MNPLSDIARMLALVPYLQANPGVQISDVAQRFEVSVAKIHRDLWTLFVCGLPGGLPGDLIEVDMDQVDEDGQIFLSNADYLARPVRLSAHEAVTVLAGLNSLREVAGSQHRTVIDAAINKTRQVVSSGADISKHLRVHIERGAPGVVDGLEEAIAARRQVCFGYQVEGRAPQERVVDPAALAMRDGHGYLIAWDTVRADWRTFRLDRINAVDDVGAAEAHSGAPDLARGWFGTNASTVTVRLAPQATWVVEKYPVRKVSTDEAGLVVELPVVDRQWLIRLLLRLGNQAELVDAEDLVSQTQRQAVAALETYRRCGLAADQ